MKISTEFLHRLERIPSSFHLRFLQTVHEEGGSHLSTRFGTGTEFAHHRKYHPGDDLRYLDWKLYARFRSFYIKNFSAEDSQSVYFFIDASRSMDFGRVNKFNYALTLAAGLSLLSLRALDRVSLCVWDTHLRQSCFNLRGKPSFARGIRFFESQKPNDAKTDLAASCRELIARQVIPGPIWIISDFYDADKFSSALHLLAYHRFLPLPIRVLDRTETKFPYRGEHTLVDSETGVSLQYHAAKGEKTDFEQQFDRLSARLRHLTQCSGFRFWETMTDYSVERFLMDILGDFQ